MAVAVSPSVSRPARSNFVLGAAMPRWSTTYAPCQVSDWTSMRRAWRPPDVAALSTATGVR